MRQLLPGLALGAVRARDGSWEATWTSSIPPFWALASTFCVLALVGICLGAPLLGTLLIVVGVERAVGLLPRQHARWNHQQLTLEGPVDATWSWETIDELGFTDANRLRIVAQGKVFWIDAPVDEQARTDLLTYWTACLHHAPPRLPFQTSHWQDDLDGRSTLLRFLEGPAEDARRPSPLRPALWVALALVALDVAVDFAVEPTTALAFMLTFGLGVVAAITSIIVLVGRYLLARRRGTLRIGRDQLLLQPAEGREQRFTWDGIRSLTHDELELCVTTDEGSFTYDFSAVAPAQVRATLAEVEAYWRAKTSDEADEHGREAMRRLQQAAGQA